MALRTKLGIDIDADTRGADAGISRTSDKVGRLGGIAAGAGKIAAGGLGLIAAGAGFVAKEVSESASRQQQAMGAIETVFGKAADKVENWADRAALAVGLSKSEYSELATVVGAQLQNMGMSQDESAKRAKALIATGADMAATYGGSVADAVASVSSLMRGEADPIERYGVGIKKADVNARLAKEGLGELEGQALKNAEANALLSLLNEQTAKTTGAFAREADTAAGAGARWEASLENVKAKAGEALLPVITNLTNMATEKLLPGLERVSTVAAKTLGPAFKRLGGFIKDDVIPVTSALFGWYADKIAPALEKFARTTLRAMGDAFAKVRAEIEENRPQLEKLVNAFKKAAEFFADKIYPVLGKLAETYFKALGDAIGLVIDAVALLVDWFEKVIGWAGKVKDAFDKIPKLNINLPSLPFSGRSAPGGGTAPPALPPTDPGTGPATGTVDARSYLTVNVDASGLLVDENALAQQLVGILTRWAQRNGAPAPILGTGF